MNDPDAADVNEADVKEPDPGLRRDDAPLDSGDGRSASIQIASSASCGNRRQAQSTHASMQSGAQPDRGGAVAEAAAAFQY
ncbi:MAG: hypothetical protein ABIW82_17650, partial [Dokdonella sp.]